jgi:hypothetical protein
MTDHDSVDTMWRAYHAGNPGSRSKAVLGDHAFCSGRRERLSTWRVKRLPALRRVAASSFILNRAKSLTASSVVRNLTRGRRGRQNHS